MSARDKTLDRLRGFAMLWVIFVHVLYWGDFFSSDLVNLLKSFCLFEMPLFFFITGATNRMSRDTSYLDFVRKRFLRILIPYWIFAGICVVLSISSYTLSNGVDLVEIVKIALSWSIPVDRQISYVSYLTWALWFIPVYLCVVLLIPLMKKAAENSAKRPVCLVIIAVLFVCFSVLGFDWLQKILFYALWTYIGMFYKEIKELLPKKSFKITLASVFAISAAVLAVMHFLGVSVDMQENKFPPDIVFFVYSIGAMALIVLLLPYLDRVLEKIERNKVFGRVLELFSTRSMTVYLYQVFAFNLSIRLAGLIPDVNIWTDLASTFVCLIITIPLCALLSLIFGKTETLGQNSRKKQPIQKTE